MNWAFAVEIAVALFRFFPEAAKAVKDIIDSTDKTAEEKAAAIAALKAGRPLDEANADSYVPRDV